MTTKSAGIVTHTIAGFDPRVTLIDDPNKSPWDRDILEAAEARRKEYSETFRGRRLVRSPKSQPDNARKTR